jgi:hypothetical protein
MLSPDEVRSLLADSTLSDEEAIKIEESCVAVAEIALTQLRLTRAKPTSHNPGDEYNKDVTLPKSLS